jgi:uncharacterized protein (DUF302 family)
LIDGGRGRAPDNHMRFYFICQEVSSEFFRSLLGRTGLMSFVQVDHGAVVRKATGRDTPRMVRLVIGNPLIMQEMAKHVPDAGTYAPVTVLVDERPDGVHLSYDRMASFLAPFGNSDALEVARNLDKKVEGLLMEAAA